MALRDDALNFLRQVFGRERAEREKAESPSAEAEKHIPTSIFSVWGREDVGGLLSVSQNLMDRYADYEQMDDYPDINCLSGDTMIYVVDGSIIKPFRLHDLAANGGGLMILAYDVETQRLVKVPAGNPRVTGNKRPVVEVGFSNGQKIKCTSNHKFLTVEHDYVNCSDLIVGTEVVSAWSGFDPLGMSTFLHPLSGTLSVTQAAQPAGEEDVYDVTTSTHNLIADGVVVHNSTHHYFTNDATQPDIDTGKTIWVHSNDEAIKDMTDTLLNKRLRIEDDIWSMVYGTVKMGNNYEEVLVTEHGVVGLNSLPCPTVRRVEQSNGALIGYVQDVTGKFTQDAADLRGMLAGQTKIPDHVALFEEWQVLHSRLRGTVRRCPYGFGVADGARWIWKRLVLLEDAMLIYKLCLRGDSQIWTPDGRKAIKELEEGDEVYSYTKKDKLRKTRVSYKRHNGQDTIYRVYSDHREIFANKTHPVLVEEIIGHGSGKPRARFLKYVEVQNLEPGKHRLITPKKNADDWEEVDVDQACGDVLTRVRVTYKVASQLGRVAQTVPSELFRASPQVMFGFISGVMRGQGIASDEGIVTGGTEFLTDLRELAMQAGFEVGFVQQYRMNISLYPQPMTEMLRGVEEVGVDDIWDIGVEDEEHNFIADGAVVHNTRAPARFAFYIDVTDIPSDKVESFLRKAKQDLRKQKLVNPRTQRLDMRFNPMDNMEDFFIAVRENRELARVEVLQGPDYQATEDVEYFQRKLHGVLKIPRNYLGQDDAIPARSILSYEDVRSARVTMGVQREVRNSIRRLIQIDLAARGINPFKQDLQVMMTVPSGIYELAHNEIKNARADFATRVQPFVSMRYIQERILKLTDEEITKIDEQRLDDQKKEADQAKMMAEAGGAPPGAGGGGGPPGGGAPDSDALAHPGNADVGPPPGVGGRPDNRAEWKAFDNARRLEERRDQMSRQRDQEIQDKMNKVLQSNKTMAHTLAHQQQFFREFKHAAFSRNGNGKLTAAPQGAGHRRRVK